jgi:hypothetical protein
LNSSETKRADAEAKLADAESKLVEREAKLKESGPVIVALQASKASLQDTLKVIMKETDIGHRARLRGYFVTPTEECGVILDSLESLEEEKVARKQNEYKAKSSQLRSFRWKEKDVDSVVLQGAVAFWTATVGEKDGTVELRKRRAKQF